MKKSIAFLLFTILLGTLQLSYAIPAKLSKFTKIQPDGSTITLQRHGDEFYHWTTAEDGSVMELDANGFYVPASMPDPSIQFLGGRENADREAALIRAKRANVQKQLLAAGSYKTYHFPVILVEFSDVKFTSSDPNKDFWNLLNQEGYSENGGTGSVRDYYWENSMGTFLAEFDVYGPYPYNGACADNAEEDDAAKLLKAAIDSYDSQIDWSKYDNDNDGEVDMVFLYYAGYNEAEGNDNTIWPHKYNFTSAGYKPGSKNGKTFFTYACTSELKGTPSYGSGMCGIGTCAHEFSHTQGLPDFYDTNYDNYGDGQAGATYTYDIMCSGSYNNEGRTPPYFSAEERIMMGWLDGLQDMPSEGSVVIPDIGTSNTAYKLATSNTSGNGEYFIFETRSGTGWDAYVEPGLIVYHADKSTKYTFTVKRSSSASYSWNGYQVWNSYTSYINASGSHPCFYIVPAADQANLDYSNDTKLPFPGKGAVTYYSPTDWAGSSDYGLFSSISFHSDGSSYGYDGASVVTMTRGENYKGVCGIVTNSAGEPVAGAAVSVYAASSADSGAEKISGRILGNLKIKTVTDENGYYSFDLSNLTNASVDIEIAAKGYITKYQTFEVGDELITRNFQLRAVGEPIDYTLKKFDMSAGNLYIMGYGQTCTSLGSIRLSSEDLSEYAGRKILKLAFAYSIDDEATVSEVYGIIDFGGTRKLTSKVDSPQGNSWNVIDISDQDLYVPSGTDCYFGYALVSCTDGYPLIYSNNNPQDGGFNYMITTSSSVPSSSSWNAISNGNLLVYVVLDDSSEVDYSYIANPGYGSYKVGEEFALTLVEAQGDRKPEGAVQWYFDDEPVSGESVALKYAGYHLVEARFTTVAGKTEIVELEINVEL